MVYRSAMSEMAQSAESVARKYALLHPHLDERQRRLVLGLEATELGRGGIKAVAVATGVHPDTVARGVREVAGEIEVTPRVRATGGGRKKLTVTDPAVLDDLRALVAPATRGDPMSLSTKIADAYKAAGDLHADTVPSLRTETAAQEVARAARCSASHRLDQPCSTARADATTEPKRASN